MGVTCSGVGASFCKPSLRGPIANFGFPRAAAWSLTCRHKLVTAHINPNSCRGRHMPKRLQRQLTLVRSQSDLINLATSHEACCNCQELLIAMLRQPLVPKRVSACHICTWQRRSGKPGCNDAILQEKQVSKAFSVRMHNAQCVFNFLRLISERILADLQLLQQLR